MKTEEIRSNSSEDNEPVDLEDKKLIGEATLRILDDLSDDKKLNSAEHLDESIYKNVELALSRCEFEITPEISKAIEGFYTDHLTLMSVIRAATEGDYSSDVISRVIKADDYQDWEKKLAEKHPFYEQGENYRPLVSPNAKVYSLQLARYINSINQPGVEIDNQTKAKLLSLASQSLSGLFTESSVGISTLDDNQIKEACTLADKLVQEAESIGSKYLYYLSSHNNSLLIKGSELEYSINSAKESFWKDVRHAGSLVFHGSSDLGGINLHGLMSRNKQLETTGEMNNNTALNFGGDTMHSVVPHFSEFYSMGEYSMGKLGGTVAIPLIKVIEKAPYARDAEYGVVKHRASSNRLVSSPALDRPIGSIGAGEPDYISSQGTDRVFFASADERSDKLPDDYSISLFDKSNKPATFVILKGPNHTADRDLHGLGYGHGFPERLVIDFPETEDLELHEKYEKQREEAAKLIIELQKEYLRAYQDYGVVVPLRRGVFAQVFENMPVDQQKGRAAASKYNAYKPGSGKRV